MRAPPFPPDEVQRLDALHSLGLLGSDPDPEFDAVARLARQLFGVPICLVTLIDKDTQHFKSCVGLNILETPRGVSFCAHAILQREAFVVLDASKDARFHDNPLVTGGPRIRFYAGAPIWLPSGYPIGALCVISPFARREFDQSDMAQLSSLAESVLNVITLRALRDEMDGSRADAERYRAALMGLGQAVAITDAAGGIQDCNDLFVALAGDIFHPSFSDEGGSCRVCLPGWNSEDHEGSEDSEILISHSRARLRVRRDQDGFILFGGGRP